MTCLTSSPVIVEIRRSIVAHGRSEQFGSSWRINVVGLLGQKVMQVANYWPSRLGDFCDVYGLHHFCKYSSGDYI